MRRRYITLILLISAVFTTAVSFADSYRSANYILSDAKIIASKGRANSSAYLLTDVEIGNVFTGKAQSQNYTLEADPIILARKAPNPPTLNPVTTPTNVTPQILSGAKDPYTSIWINGYQKVPLDNKTTWSCDITLAEGDNYLSITAKNIYGLESSSVIITITLDTVSPTGTIIINNGDVYTNQTAVTLNLSADDSSGITQMQFSNDNTTYSSPEAYQTTKQFILPSSDGTKTVYVKFKDSANNWSAPVSDTIILDTTPPTRPGIISPTIYYINTTFLTITGTKSADTTAIIITSPSGTVGSVTYPSNTTWRCTLTDLTPGHINITIKAKDIANNESAPIYLGLWLDVTLPTGTIKINNDSQYTKLTTVTLTLSATDNLDYVTQMQFSNDDVNWSNPELYQATKQWDLIPGDSEKTVYVKYKDQAGNWSNPISDTIILDTTAPEIVITSPANNTHTNQNPVTINYTVDGTVKTKQHTFPNQGPATITITETDPAGNTATENITLTYDNIPPTITLTPPPRYTNQNVILNPTATDNYTQASEIIITGNNSPYTQEGTYNITITAKDKADNQATLNVPTFTIDTTAPTQVSVTDQGNYTTNNNQLSVSWTQAQDASTGIKEYKYAIGTSAGATDVIDWTQAGLNTTATITGLSLLHSPTYYISIRAYDNAGNYSQSNSDGIEYDSPPQIASFTVDLEPSFHQNTQVILNTTATDTDNDTIEYKYMVRDTTIQNYSSQPQTTWNPYFDYVRETTLKVYAKANGQEAGPQEKQVYIFREPKDPQ